MASPYERVLGAELDGLHPRLRTYFSEIPAGSVGRGSGVFDRVGTPRRWLAPALWVLGRLGIAFPVWARDVPFRIENRPVVSGSGVVAVSAIRVFDFVDGERRMIDAITAEADGLVDHLGPSRILAAELDAVVGDGELQLHSRGLRVRMGARAIRVPNRLAPIVRLIERFDDDVGRQHVSITLTVPLVGRIYEYSGFFDYRIETDAADAADVADGADGADHDADTAPRPHPRGETTT